jgi:hypothetical protein
VWPYIHLRDFRSEPPAKVIFYFFSAFLTCPAHLGGVVGFIERAEHRAQLTTLPKRASDKAPASFVHRAILKSGRQVCAAFLNHRQCESLRDQGGGKALPRFGHGFDSDRQ